MLDIVTMYTDGSCHTASQAGGWAAIIMHNQDKIVLQGSEFLTTHQRMELMAVISSLEYVIANNMDHFMLEVCSDSQYVVGMENRKDALRVSRFLTKKGVLIRNSDLVRRLIGLIEPMNIKFVKVKAHQKVTDGPNFNREVDILCRKIVRKHQK